MAGLRAGNAVTVERCRQCDSSALPKSAFARISVHTCATTYVFNLLPRESTHFPIHLHASFSVSILHRCTALYRIVSAPIYSMCQINSSVFPALQLLCDAVSSPELQLHSKEQSKITSHFLSFTCFFLPFFFFFPPSGTVPFYKCLEAENVSDARASRRLVKGARGVWGERQNPGQWEP